MVVDKLGGIYDIHIPGEEMTRWSKQKLIVDFKFYYYRCTNKPGKDRYLKNRAFRVQARMNNNNSDIMKLIRDYGPVAVSIYRPDTWDNPKGPHVQVDKCDGKKTPNHVVAIVGYDRDEQDAYRWIIKNSYGTGWRDNGFLRIMMRPDRFDCGIKNKVLYLTDR